MTTGQPGPSVFDANAYRNNLFRLLGGRDPLEVRAQTALVLADIVRAHSVTVLRARPAEGSGLPTKSSATSSTANGCTAIALD